MAWIRSGNKPESDARPEPSSSRSVSQEPPAAASPPVTPKPAPEKQMERVVNIGQSVEIKGELNGNEDLTIEGKVDGKITLKDHALTVGANGRIKGEIFAKTVLVVGEVDGNISADDRVEVAATGSMMGDIVSPRVVLSDGARFKGSIDMDQRPKAVSQPTPSSGSSSPTKVAAGGSGSSSQSAHQPPRSAAGKS